MLYMRRCKRQSFQTGGNPCKNSQRFKPQQPQTALKEKNTKSVKKFLFFFFLFFKEFWKNDPVRNRNSTVHRLV